MMSSRVQKQSLSLHTPERIMSCALLSHTSVPWDRPEMRISSAMEEGLVSSSICRTNLVPNSGMPNVPLVTPRIWLGARSSGSGLENSPSTLGSLRGSSVALMPVRRSSMLIMVGSS